MKIEILGPGCPRCVETEKRAREAVKLAGLEAEVTHLYDPKAMAERHVMFTPAVVVDGVVKVSGEIPTVQKLVTTFIDCAAASEN